MHTKNNGSRRPKYLPVRILIQIRKFLGLPDSDPSVRGTDLDPSIRTTLTSTVLSVNPF
jgi:hypothetical protein